MDTYTGIDLHQAARAAAIADEAERRRARLARLDAQGATRAPRRAWPRLRLAASRALHLRHAAA